MAQKWDSNTLQSSYLHDRQMEQKQGTNKCHQIETAGANTQKWQAVFNYFDSLHFQYVSS